VKRELDEIEAELKGVSVKYRCDHADRCDRHLGKCIAREPHLLHPECATRPEKCPTTEWQVKCIPVEPERVKEDAFPQWHPPCGFQGLCHNGWGSKWCAECPWFDKAPSPGLLQRMGMCVWPEEQWIVTSLDFGWYTTE
jgi:hypothetical protein